MVNVVIALDMLAWRVAAEGDPNLDQERYEKKKIAQRIHGLLTALGIPPEIPPSLPAGTTRAPAFQKCPPVHAHLQTAALVGRAAPVRTRGIPHPRNQFSRPR